MNYLYIPAGIGMYLLMTARDSKFTLKERAACATLAAPLLPFIAVSWVIGKVVR